MFVQTMYSVKAEDKFERSNQCVNQREEINPFVQQTFFNSDVIKCQSSGREQSSSLALKLSLQISRKESVKEADLLFLLQLVWGLRVYIRPPTHIWNCQWLSIIDKVVFLSQKGLDDFTMACPIHLCTFYEQEFKC